MAVARAERAAENTSRGSTGQAFMLPSARRAPGAGRSPPGSSGADGAPPTAERAVPIRAKPLAAQRAPDQPPAGESALLDRVWTAPTDRDRERAGSRRLPARAGPGFRFQARLQVARSPKGPKRPARAVARAKSRPLADREQCPCLPLWRPVPWTTV